MSARVYVWIALLMFAATPLLAGVRKCGGCGSNVPEPVTQCLTCGAAVPLVSRRELPPRTQAVKHASRFESVRKGLVIVQTAESAGSGFVILMNGKKHIVTNAHLLSDPTTVSFQTVEGKQLKYLSIEMADMQDLARVLLAEPTDDIMALPISTGEPAMNQAVTVYGNSEGEGVVTELDGRIIGVGPQVVETDAQFVRGNSGSPVVDAKGAVVAVATYATRTAPGMDWVADNTRFTCVRRFGLRLRDITWIPVHPLVLKKQLALLSDIDRFLAEVFSIIPAWLPQVSEASRASAIEARKAYSLRRDISMYVDPHLPQIINEFCLTHAALLDKAREKWRPPVNVTRKSFSFQEAERKHKAAIQELHKKMDHCLTLFYNEPARAIEGTPWLTQYLRGEALARKPVLEVLKECMPSVRASWQSEISQQSAAGNMVFRGLMK